MDISVKNKFSRQIGAVGAKTMEKLMDLNIMIVGAGPVGMEAIKCISLLGIKSLHVVDKDKLTKKQKQHIYYHSETAKTLGENATEFSKHLNSSLIVNNCKSIDMSYIVKNNIKAVIITKISNYDILNIDKFCVENNVKLILGINYELEGYVFSNFNNHTITDKDGEFCVSGFVEEYTKTEETINITVEKLDNNVLSTKGKLVSGINEINIDILGGNQTCINILADNKIEEFIQKNNNVKFVEVKESFNKQYKSLSEKYKDDLNDYTFISDSSSFSENHHDYKQFLERIITQKEPISSHKTKAPFFILSSIIGGIIAHEVIKITGKYMPIEQEIYINYENLRGENFYRSGNNRNSQILDREVIKQLKKMNVFMVGCGALGCELSKNMGMLDMCSNMNSQLSITDMDVIEQSNLNRQFLFGNNDIGSKKSDVVKTKLKEYCPAMNVKEFDYEVGKKTENTFNAVFWDNNDIIINALDNVEARKYVDSRCVEFEKPLFESGTLGPKCNTQTIIPFKTATYSELTDMEEKSIPMCTIKSFPNKIEHCIEWGLDIFHTYISQAITDLHKIISYNKDFKDEVRTITNEFNLNQKLTILDKYVDLYYSRDFKDFIKLFDFMFKYAFEYPILDVLATFPEDLTNTDGSSFWSGKKLKPSVRLMKDIDVSFAKSIYEIINSSFRLNAWDNDYYTEFISDYKSENYKGKTIIVDESKDTVVDETIMNSSITIDTISKKLEGITLNTVATIEYDKDDDIMLNGMAQISNMRADIYNIDKVDILDIKLISGKIIPALSTTTTVISGFVMIELLKYVNSIYKSVYKPCDINVNLGLNQYILFDSMKPGVTYDKMFSPAYNMKVRTIPYKFNTWNKIKVSTTKECCPDIKELVSIIKSDHKIPVNMMTYGSYVIYDCNSNKDKTIYELFDELNIPKCENIKLNIYAYDSQGMPIITPPLIIEN